MLVEDKVVALPLRRDAGRVAHVAQVAVDAVAEAERVGEAKLLLEEGVGLHAADAARAEGHDRPLSRHAVEPLPQHLPALREDARVERLGAEEGPRRRLIVVAAVEQNRTDGAARLAAALAAALAAGSRRRSSSGVLWPSWRQHRVPVRRSELGPGAVPIERGRRVSRRPLPPLVALCQAVGQNLPLLANDELAVRGGGGVRLHRAEGGVLHVQLETLHAPQGRKRDRQGVELRLRHRELAVDSLRRDVDAPAAAEPREHRAHLLQQMLPPRAAERREAEEGDEAQWPDLRRQQSRGRRRRRQLTPAPGDDLERGPVATIRGGHGEYAHEVLVALDPALSVPDLEQRLNALVAAPLP
mmetsp:Transcript_12297/g.35524  ORF Transcript_12297/g.35524 Transcript_12297/m.35524 type:complete len:357 (-) Transcript_12297:314-1384(-)